MVFNPSRILDPDRSVAVIGRANCIRLDGHDRILRNHVPYHGICYDVFNTRSFVTVEIRFMVQWETPHTELGMVPPRDVTGECNRVDGQYGDDRVGIQLTSVRHNRVLGGCYRPCGQNWFLRLLDDCFNIRFRDPYTE